MNVSDIPSVLLKDTDLKHNVELVSDIQHLLHEVLISYKAGIPLYEKDTVVHADAILLAQDLLDELKARFALQDKSAFAATNKSKKRK